MVHLKRYKVLITKKALKRLHKMPEEQQELFYLLKEELAEKGAVRSNWPNYSKLGKIAHHCHLSNRWVAVWRLEKNSIEVEVYYVGSREDAPY
ncbi:MAG: hypothetical protein PF518_05355 [Spirochaetaceae bacterium]|jgi:mRNA-degrading endonuclease RelE of RelBE toxin-antitoxin system|nr:hypothetical protein [Spirochaetaceae bacterium]